MSTKVKRNLSLHCDACDGQLICGTEKIFDSEDRMHMMAYTMGWWYYEQKLESFDFCNECIKNHAHTGDMINKARKRVI